MMNDDFGICKCKPLINNGRKSKILSIRKENNDIRFVKVNGGTMVGVINEMTGYAKTAIVISDSDTYNVYDGEKDIVIEVLKKRIK